MHIDYFLILVEQDEYLNKDMIKSTTYNICQNDENRMSENIINQLNKSNLTK